MSDHPEDDASTDETEQNTKKVTREPGNGGRDVRYSVKMDEHLKDAGLRNSEHGEMAERVRDIFRRVGYGEDVQHEQAVRKELEITRDKIDEVDAEIRDLQSEREKLSRKATRLEERVQKTDSRKEKYSGMLDSAESMLARGGHVDPTHPIVQDAADLMKIPAEEVIEDLKERHPAVPDHAFVPFDETDKEWNGFDN